MVTFKCDLIYINCDKCDMLRTSIFYLLSIYLYSDDVLQMIRHERR